MTSSAGKQLAVFFAVGLIIGLSASQLAAGFGFAFPESPLTLIITLVVLGFTNYFASFPIFHYRRQLERYQDGPRPARPNPFYAVRVLILARASALTGALFAGWHLGLVLWLVLFSVSPAGLLASSGFGFAGAAVLVAGGLLSQWNCKSPPDSPTDSEGSES